MTKRNVFFSIGAAALAVAIAVPAAFSHGPDGDRERGDRGAHFEQRMKEKLGLDDQQVARLQTLKQKQGADADALREQVESARDELQALITAPTVDKAKILAAAREVNALEGQLQVSRIEFMLAARSVLTPEQFTKFSSFRKDHGGKRWGHHGRHMRGQRNGPDAPDSPDTEQ